jgi:hypothetical protein
MSSTADTPSPPATADVPIELILNCARPGAHRLGSRRFLPRGTALERLDALMCARPFSVEEVLLLANRYRGARGVRLLKDVLPLVEDGAASPRETALRLLFIDAGPPRPTTQIPIYDHDGNYLRTVDMGWEEVIRQAWDAMVSRGWRP